jgi:biotin carboxylase
MLTHNIFSGKRLLILGANPETVPLIETAQKMGLLVAVTDNNPDAYAKSFADESYDVDGMDVEGLVELVRNKDMNAVLVGVADRLIVPYQKVCEITGLPSYGTAQQCKILTDKFEFNQICKAYDIPNIPSISIDRNYKENELEGLQYPVFIKPVDGNSGKGMSLCHNREDLLIGIEKAQSVSGSGRLLLERYMDCEDILINYTIVNGEPFLSALADRFTTREQSNVSRVCIGAKYPSRFWQLFTERYHSRFVNLLKGLGIENAIFTVSAFVENGEIFVYDPGFRLQGEAPNLHMEAVNGFDQKAMLINFAITGSMGYDDVSSLSNSRFEGKPTATIWYLCRQGTIDKIKGIDLIRNDHSVFQVVQRLHEGDEVSANMVGTEAQVLARVYLVSDSKEQLIDKVNFFQRTLKVLDANGDSMLLNGFDSKLIQ